MTRTPPTPADCPDAVTHGNPFRYCGTCNWIEAPTHAIDATARHASVQAVTRFFDHAHLPKHLAAVSEPFAQLAAGLLVTIPKDDPELTVALRKLLEAKDAAVRAAVAIG